MKTKIKAYYKKHKREIRIFSAGVATASAVAYHLHTKTVDGWKLAHYEERNADGQNWLYVKTRNGQKGRYPIIDED